MAKSEVIKKSPNSSAFLSSATFYFDKKLFILSIFIQPTPSSSTSSSIISRSLLSIFCNISACY